MRLYMDSFTFYSGGCARAFPKWPEYNLTSEDLVSVFYLEKKKKERTTEKCNLDMFF